ncbi:MAG: fimbrial biogenesis outer membrane usher protein [Aromatoleum sp.]|nr:fimbrial biogenesis outer membrane usher protein [Aromatoleum sp.]
MVALLVAAASLPVWAQTGLPPPGVEPPAGDELLLEVDVNDQHLDDTALLLRTPDERFWVTASDLRKWRLRVPDAPARERGGERFLPLDAIPGVTYRYDAPRQRLLVTAPPRAFAESVVSTERPPYPKATVPTPGGFFNYGVSAAHATGVWDYAAQVEAGFFSRYGVLVGGMLAQDNAQERKVIRLDTTYTLDVPHDMLTLRIGDTVTVPGSWGRAVRIGGLQFGTNFGLQPGFVAFPSVAANGQAALPSTVDVFVNNALVAQRSVPPGPFSITHIPTVTGGGNVQLVVRDLLGRETLISQPFYASSQLLATGLTDYSLEAGFERNDFGTASADYGRAVGSATYRRGITDQITGELRGEVMRDQATVGAAATWLFAGIGIVDGTVAVSEARGAGSGTLAALGFEKESGRAGLSLRAQWASEVFRLAGAGPENPIPKLQLSANAGYQFGAWGNVNATYVSQRFRTQPNVEVASIVYSTQVAGKATIALSALRSFGSDHATTFTATLSIPFNAATSASLAQTSRRGGESGASNETQFTLQRNLPVGEGYGYRLLARTPSEVQANFTLQRNFGTYVAEVSRFQGETAARVSASGGVGILGGHVFASREISESFGVVRVDDYPGVGILVDNQPAARTNSGGYAVLPRLRAYDVNRISIEQRDLPLDAQVDRLKIDAVPYYRSGVLALFPIRRSHGATFSVRLDDDTALPAGATLQVIGQDEQFPMGLDGQAYVTGLGRDNRLRGSWRGQTCEFDIPFLPTSDPLPDLGTYVCRGIAR